MSHLSNNTPNETPLCADHFESANGWEPEMGDEGMTFEPGTCAECGTVGTVFSEVAL